MFSAGGIEKIASSELLVLHPLLVLFPLAVVGKELLVEHYHHKIFTSALSITSEVCIVAEPRWQGPPGVNGCMCVRACVRV